MKATVTQDERGLTWEIKDDGSRDYRNNPMHLTPEQRLAVDWASRVAAQQSQVAIHKTLRAMLD